MTMPSIIAKAKSWITSPPKTKRAAAVRKTVSDVTMVLESTSLILSLTISKWIF